MNICDLIEAAKANQQITSDSRLAISMGIGPSTISQIRQQRHVPGDDFIVSLCKLADIPPEIGLLWAASWRCKGEARKIWERMANQASKKAKLPPTLSHAA